MRDAGPLKLDYDSDAERVPLRQLRRRLQFAGYRIKAHAAKRSPSGRGWHVVLTTDPPIGTPMEVVALQAVCGSDPYREASNVLRARILPAVPPFWQQRWNVLYAAKPVAQPMVQQKAKRKGKRKG